MHLFKQFKTIFNKSTQQKSQQQQSSPKSSGTSFQVIVSQILQEPPSQDFVLLQDGGYNQQISEEEGVENMYVKGFLLIGKKCQGKLLTVKEWKQIIQKQDLSLVSKKDIYFSVFQGIDYTVRKDVWQLLANAPAMKKQAKLSFEQLSDPSQASEKDLNIIQKDVVRTTIVTKNLKELRQILIAYARLSEKGYTQGMNLIAGVLLRLLAIDNDQQMKELAIVEVQLAERVFWVLVGIMKWKKWSEVYENDLSGTQRMLGVLRDLMQDNVPKILDRIENQGWDLTIFAQYYVTICLYNCPNNLAPIILDLFLLDGESVIHALLIRMMVLNQDKILKFQDEMALMKYLKMEMLHDTYLHLLRNRANAKCLEDFDLNFLKTAF